MRHPNPAMIAEPAIQSLLRRTAQRLRRRCVFGHDDFDDLVQELSLQLLLRWEHYDEQRATIEGFVRGVLPSIVSNMNRERMAQKRWPGSIVSLSHEGDSPVWDEHCDRRRSETSEHDLERRIERLDVNDYLAALPQDERDLLQDVGLEGQRATARRRAIGRHQIRTTLSRLRAALAAYEKKLLA